MALWDPSKVKPLAINRQIDTSAVDEAMCYWCGDPIKDFSEDEGNNPQWGTGLGNFGCEENPLGCDFRYNTHFHGYIDDPHDEQEANEWEMEWDPETEDGEYCTVGGHEPIGAVIQRMDKNLLTTNGRRDDRPTISSHFMPYREKELLDSCVSGTCGEDSCHACNPDSICEMHKTCINSRKCSECGQQKANVVLDWSDEHKEECDEPKHPEYEWAPQDTLHTRRAWDEGINPAEDTTAESYVVEHVLGEHAYRRSKVLDKPVCYNKECRNYGVEED